MDLPDRPIDRLLEIMRVLRSERGCPWDREQTLDTLKPYLVEECYEAIDALEAGDRAKLCEELGDVLLQIVFQAQICAEEKSFAFDDVAAAISAKLIRRHPHVFGDATATDSAEVVRRWDAIKRAEAKDAGEAPKSAVDGVPRHMPALRRAAQVQGRAARAGFDWKAAAPVVGKLDEEIAELKDALAGGAADRIRDEIGDILFTVVNLTRFLSCDAEDALNQTTGKFMRRFKAVEARVHAQGRTMSACTLEELDVLWNEVKRAERVAGGA